MIHFSLQARDTHSKARIGKLITSHGAIETPCFIPVGTQAAVKGLTPKHLSEIGAQIVLANTYHLLLRPGAEVVEEMGGLSKFMGWNGPTMTDSGGFQVFSLGAAQEWVHKKGEKLTKFSQTIVDPQDEKVFDDEEQSSFLRQVKMKPQRIKPAKIDEKGVTFYSHLNGNEYRLTPQSSIKIQEQLGADLIVAFDDHESPLWNYEETKCSLERTNRWALESLAAHKRKDQLMYGVTHGGVFEDLRKESAKFTDMHFNAIAIGGAYTSKEVLYKVIEWTIPLVEEDKPRHLLGIAEVQDLFEGIERGMDFFDCVAPTRRARHGSLYISPKNGGNRTNGFTMQISNSQFTKDQNPIDADCECYTCQSFSRAYIQHLFKARELLAFELATYHNVYFITHMVSKIRQAIGEGRFDIIKNEWLDKR